ncbi:MAG TPA: M28 family peptidase, partial [Solirubrobacteraceae bacterium]
MTDPARVLAGLDALHALTGDGPRGAFRVAWTDGWARARGWLRAQLAEIEGVRVETDEAGNLWATRAAPGEPVVAVGSHLDSVPAGGRLDGALGVLAALEILRTTEGVALVDWADEEGARFGHSLLGSAAAAGMLDVAAARGLTDADGVALPDALAEHGVQLDAMPRAAARL